MCSFYRWLTKTPKGAYSYTGGEQRQFCGAKSREASAGGQRVCARRTRVSDAITTRGRIGRNWAMCEAGGWDGISETIKKRLDFYRTSRRTDFFTRSLTFFFNYQNKCPCVATGKNIFGSLYILFFGFGPKTHFIPSLSSGAIGPARIAHCRFQPPKDNVVSVHAKTDPPHQILHIKFSRIFLDLPKLVEGF